MIDQTVLQQLKVRINMFEPQKYLTAVIVEKIQLEELFGSR